MHQFWFQGADKVPPKYHASMQRLRELNPEWDHHVWEDRDLRAACAEVGPDALQAYDRARIMHQKIDLGRMCMLYVHGGVSLDMDIQPLRPLSDIPGIERVHQLTLSLLPLSSFESIFATRACHKFRDDQICSAVNNACLIAPPRDPALLHVIRYCSSQLLHEKPRGIDVDSVARTTGPMAVAHALMSMPPGLKATMLPARYLEPCIGADAHCRPGADAVLYHQHDNTWVPGELTAFFTLYFEAKHNWELVLVAVVLALLAYRMLRRRR